MATGFLAQTFGNPTQPTSLRKAINEEHILLKRGIVVGDLLGEGSYACVYSGFLEKERMKCAIKVINKRKAPKDFLQRFLPRELEILKTIKHPNIIRCYEIVEIGTKVYISMELAGHGDLLEYIKLRGALPEAKARNFFRQLLDGVSYLHNKNIVHRDLKCENLLLDGHNNIKITDFGFSRRITKSDLSKTFCGSAAYAAPEILLGRPYQGFLYDVWSMGVILYIMVCGSMPYDDSNVKRMVRDQTEKKLGFSRSKQLTLDCKDLVLRMLTPEPARRATLYDIHHHAWMQEPGGLPPCVPKDDMEGPLQPNRPKQSPVPTADDPGHTSSGCNEQVIQTTNHEEPPRAERMPFNPKFVPI
ncbi:testis-specific serine/threonine-protein kinase 1-like [Acanthaster planci]|uniref:Testis-specific serine/threonine-protein kinase 1-like n=1 Tax=Acanthaster planci TaxID=133434 RepID=A0A8B7Y729_ACAPL|nr:testis-specific serine/threonine-protein kinase 1-like [Acanthaster planci]